MSLRLTGRIAWHEWRSLMADRTLVVVLFVLTAAAVYGLYNGAQWVAFQHETIGATQAEERSRLERLRRDAGEAEAGRIKVSPFRDPRSPAVLGRGLGARYAAMQPAPLAPLVVGQSDLLPYYFKVTTDARETVTAATEIENPHRLLTGRFDLAFVIIYLYPLLILALAYNLLSGEKEQGTLALALSQPIALSRLVAIKVGARAAGLVAIVAALALAGLMATSTGLSDWSTAVRFLLWVAAVAAYGAFWFALAVLVGALGRGSAVNAMTLAGVWLGLVLVVPASVNLVAATLYPVPSRVEMVQAVREASDAATAEGSRLLAKYYEDHPELAADNSEQAMRDFNFVRVAVNDDVERRVAPALQRFDAQLARQQRLVGRLRFLSPAILAQEAMSDLAGTGVARHRHFLALVDDYHQEWRAFIVPRIFRRVSILDHDVLPRFAFRDEPERSVVARVVMNVGALVMPAVVLAVVGFRRLRRYPLTA
jgi:ABC-2 type transport system permease protein